MKIIRKILTVRNAKYFMMNIELNKKQNKITFPCD